MCGEITVFSSLLFSSFLFSSLVPFRLALSLLVSSFLLFLIFSFLVLSLLLVSSSRLASSRLFSLLFSIALYSTFPFEGVCEAEQVTRALQLILAQQQTQTAASHKPKGEKYLRVGQFGDSIFFLIDIFFPKEI
jgi:hypothetical protein